MVKCPVVVPSPLSCSVSEMRGFETLAGARSSTTGRGARSSTTGEGRAASFSAYGLWSRLIARFARCSTTCGGVPRLAKRGFETLAGARSSTTGVALAPQPPGGGVRRASRRTALVSSDRSLLDHLWLRRAATGSGFETLAGAPFSTTREDARSSTTGRGARCSRTCGRGDLPVCSAQSRSTMTGAWSLAPLPARSSRSMKAPVTRSANDSLPSTKSRRMPRLRS